MSYYIYCVEDEFFKLFHEYVYNDNTIKYLILDKFTQNINNNTVFIYKKTNLKNKIKAGIIGILKIEGNTLSNKDDKGNNIIVNDIEAKFIIKINKFIFFDNPIYLSELNDCFNEDFTKNKFIGNYTRKTNIIKQMNEYYFINNFINYVNNNFNDIYNNYLLNKEEGDEEEEEENINNNIFIKKNEMRREKNGIKKYFESESEKKNKSITNSNEYEFDISIYDNLNNDSENDNGIIPVSVILCKNFKLPYVDVDIDMSESEDNSEDDEEKEINREENRKYFINHIKTCKKCSFVNNNPFEIVHHLINSELCMEIIYNSDDLNYCDFNIIIDKIMNLQYYDYTCGEDIDVVKSKILYIKPFGHPFDNRIIILMTFPNHQNNNSETDSN
jgi:hypothetical protein